MVVKDVCNMDAQKLSKIPMDVGMRVIRPYLEQFEAQIFAEFAKAHRIEEQARRGYQI